ncbi:MAG: ATP-binding protein, partial [Chloroflexi bacterium]|nr:ATP-binding protein [Chloroflexota bacterium]
EQLKQVYLNLIFNAVEHTSGNGFIQISVNSDNQWGIFSIQNSGSSIPDDDLQEIFRPFVTSNPDERYGLGLWVSYNIVQQHKGLLEVKNLHDQSGVTFTVKIPLVQEKEW